MAIWNILSPFGKLYDNLVHFVLIWYIFSGFGIMYRQKSGNPVHVQFFVWRKKKKIPFPGLTKS
jgi:hypothetical protein